MNNKIQKTKICTTCEEEKTVNNFYVRSKEKNWYVPECRQCKKSARQKAKFYRKKPAYIPHSNTQAEKKIIRAINIALKPMSAFRIKRATGLTYYCCRKICHYLVKQGVLDIEKVNARTSGAEHVYTLASTSKVKHLPKINPLLIHAHRCFNRTKQVIT